MSTALETFDFAKIRLFVADDLGEGHEIALDTGQTHYLAHVMRKKVGDTVLVFNGRDGEWLAEIARIGKKAVDLKVATLSRRQVATPDLELLFAPVKKLRLDFLVQKAAELGVSAIRPVITERTNTKVSEARMVANVIEAAEQSGRLDVPQIKPQLKLNALLEAWPMERALIFCDETRQTSGLSEALRASDHAGPWSILIGPEGGFSDKERDLLHGFPATLPVSLGPRIMRADTAALAALAVFQAIRGDWQVTGQTSL